MDTIMLSMELDAIVTASIIISGRKIGSDRYVIV